MLRASLLILCVSTIAFLCGCRQSGDQPGHTGKSYQQGNKQAASTLPPATPRISAAPTPTRAAPSARTAPVVFPCSRSAATFVTDEFRKQYHLLECRRATRLGPDSRGYTWYRYTMLNRRELKAKGYTPCQQCRPDLDRKQTGQRPWHDAPSNLRQGASTPTASQRSASSYAAQQPYSGAGSAQRTAVYPQAGPSTRTVYLTRTGDCYHAAGCRHLRQSMIPVSLSEAEARGKRPCSHCNP